MDKPVERYALLGWPVAHSLSPPMQDAAFSAAGIEATYELIAVPPKDLAAVMTRLRLSDYRGWNITVPHKQRALSFLDSVETAAQAAGSVNTVINRDGRLHGCSTDGYGLAAALKENFGLVPEGQTFVFVGAGGAARATSVYLAAQGAREVVIINRTLSRAETIADAIRRVAPNCRVRCLATTELDHIEDCLQAASVLVQATSLGLHENDSLPLPSEILPKHLPVLDMIYRSTPFLVQAAARGCPVADGRGMLLHQGARSFELWLEQPAPLERMRSALQVALAQK